MIASRQLHETEHITGKGAELFKPGKRWRRCDSGQFPFRCGECAG
nr:MAG TPA: Zinc-finger double domain protein [Caudoviricetes sp.]